MKRAILILALCAAPLFAADFYQRAMQTQQVAPSGGGISGWNPLTSDSPVWYLSTNGIAVSGSSATAWTNQINPTWAVNNIGSSPVYSSNTGPNGLPCVVANGTGAFFSASGMTAQPLTVIMVYQYDSLSDNYDFAFDGTNSSQRCAFTHVSTVEEEDMYAGNDLAYGPPTIREEWFLVTCVFNGSSSSVYTNGALAVSGNAGSESLAGLTVFCSHDQSLISGAAKLSAVWIGSGAMTTTEQKQANKFFHDYYFMTNIQSAYLP